MKLKVFFAAAIAATVSVAKDVVVECADFRLTLDSVGYAKSLVVKSTGEECLAQDVCIPFATLRQDRPYDNEAHLIHPAKPVSFPSDSIVRNGDMLEIGFAREYHVLKLRITISDGYVAITPEGTDYRITDDFGDKRRTEIDGIEFMRLPVRNRLRFGECANVIWDDSAAVAVMGDSPEVRIDGDMPEGVENWRLLCAGAENQSGLFGRSAVLLAGASSAFLDRVDGFEAAFGLPRGARNRRDPIMRASYCFAGGISPANVTDYVTWLKKGGFRVCMVSYRDFARSCGHFSWRDDRYPNGLDDLIKVVNSLRAAGIVPGLHIHYNKVSVNDPYVKDGADPRIASVRDLCLASDVRQNDNKIVLQGAPGTLRTEDGRRLLRFGAEVMSFEKSSSTWPWTLTGVKRGLFGTNPACHSRGDYGRHLDVDDWHYFHRIDPGSDIQDEIAARLAQIIDACRFRILYFDGGEDVPPPYWYNVPLAQKRVWDRLNVKPRGAESALKSHYGWHMLTRGNAFDTFYPERTRQALDKFILPAARLAANDFSTVNFGWIGLFLPGENTSRAGFLANNSFGDTTCGTTPESIEMVARAAYENNAPLSFLLTIGRFLKHPQREEIMAVFKKYEDLKFPDGMTLTEPDSPDMR